MRTGAENTSIPREPARRFSRAFDALRIWLHVRPLRASFDLSPPGSLGRSLVMWLRKVLLQGSYRLRTGFPAERLARPSLVLAGLGLVGAIAATWGLLAPADHAGEAQLMARYQLAEVRRGSATSRVIAAGTVQPTVSVVVGSQVSGQVTEILADHNDVVKAGQPIARLDPELLAIRVDQARAELEVARDAVLITKGDVSAAEATLHRTVAERGKLEAEAKRSEVTAEYASRKLERKSTLLKTGSNSISDADDARAAYEMALADVSSARAQIIAQEARIQEANAQLAIARSRVAHIEAQVRRSEVLLRQAEADLERTIIRAPIDGVVIDRSIAAGQTVAASFQAPTLFTVGDLRAVSVEIVIDEADIGRIRMGQQTTFSVDAYPDKTFAGTISQIRKSPHTQESVVTYTVLATADNNELLLLPGMTAKADIVTERRLDALQVPNAALRYKPQATPQPSGAHVWMIEGGSIRAVPVKVGASTGETTEVVSGSVSEGQKVIVGDAARRTGR